MKSPIFDEPPQVDPNTVQNIVSPEHATESERECNDNRIVRGEVTHVVHGPFWNSVSALQKPPPAGFLHSLSEYEKTMNDPEKAVGAVFAWFCLTRQAMKRISKVIRVLLPAKIMFGMNALSGTTNCRKPKEVRSNVGFVQLCARDTQVLGRLCEAQLQASSAVRTREMYAHNLAVPR